MYATLTAVAVASSVAGGSGRHGALAHAVRRMDLNAGAATLTALRVEMFAAPSDELALAVLVECLRKRFPSATRVAAALLPRAAAAPRRSSFETPESAADAGGVFEAAAFSAKGLRESGDGCALQPSSPVPVYSPRLPSHAPAFARWPPPTADEAAAAAAYAASSAATDAAVAAGAAAAAAAAAVVEEAAAAAAAAAAEAARPLLPGEASLALLRGDGRQSEDTPQPQPAATEGGGVACNGSVSPSAASPSPPPPPPSPPTPPRAQATSSDGFLRRMLRPGSSCAFVASQPTAWIADSRDCATGMATFVDWAEAAAAPPARAPQPSAFSIFSPVEDAIAYALRRSDDLLRSRRAKARGDGQLLTTLLRRSAEMLRGRKARGASAPPPSPPRAQAGGAPRGGGGGNGETKKKAPPALLSTTGHGFGAGIGATHAFTVGLWPPSVPDGPSGETMASGCANLGFVTLCFGGSAGIGADQHSPEPRARLHGALKAGYESEVLAIAAAAGEALAARGFRRAAAVYAARDAFRSAARAAAARAAAAAARRDAKAAAAALAASAAHAAASSASRDAMTKELRASEALVNDSAPLFFSSLV